MNITIVGCGRLGSRILIELANMISSKQIVVDKISLYDPDAVSPKNYPYLHSSIHKYSGLPKTTACKHFVSRMNPDVRVNAYITQFDINNSESDIIIDCRDIPELYPESIKLNMDGKYASINKNRPDMVSDSSGRYMMKNMDCLTNIFVNYVLFRIFFSEPTIIQHRMYYELLDIETIRFGASINIGETIK